MSIDWGECLETRRATHRVQWTNFACIVCLSLILSLIVQCLFVTGVEASSGSVITIPAGKKAKSGLQISIDTRWVEGNGYRPVRITVGVLAGAAPADRQIEMSIGLGGQRGALQTPEVRTIIEIPQGSTSVTKTVPVPYSDSWYWASIETREDGRLLDDLSAEQLGFTSVLFFGQSEAIPNVLFVHTNALTWKERLAPGFAGAPLLPDIRPLVSVLGPLSPNNSFTVFTGQSYTDAYIHNCLVNCERVELLPPSELPERWIEYSAVDVIVLYRDTLASMSPAAWEAIQRWTWAGGILCVSGDANFADRAAMESALKLESLPWPSENTPQRAWIAPNVSTTWNSDPFSTTRNRFGNGAAPVRPKVEIPMTPPFIWRSVGNGQLVLFGSHDPAKLPVQAWNCFFSSLPYDNWKWYRRHGSSISRDNVEFGNWMIPGIGKAPVFGFLILISMFVIVIGPINHYVLSRRRRTVLLLVTVPLGASIVTTGLFLYAVLHDGLGTRLRLRNHTMIDQRSGTMVCQSRQTYYAGINPSSGLIFPNDTTVFKVDRTPERHYVRLPSPYQVSMLDEQVFERGYIAARTMSQFVVTRSAETSSRLEVRGLTPDESPTSNAADSSSREFLEVENQLGTNIRMIVVRDKSGKFFFGEEIRNQEKARLSLTPMADAAGRLRVLYSKAAPEYPEGYDPDQTTASPWFSRRVYWGNNWDNSESAPTFQSGILERNLTRSLFVVGSNDNLLPGSYVAITESSPDVPIGLQKTQEVASLHVIEGNW